MGLLDCRSFIGQAFYIVDNEKYKKALELLKESLADQGATLFACDNLITWSKNLSFLRDDFFIDIVKNDTNTYTEKSTLWRLYILLYFAKIASKAEGDFVELGCHTGFSASNVIKKIDFPGLDKKYYLYDLFEWNEGDEHGRLPGHKNETMYRDVKARFSDYPFVTIIKGSVPQSFSGASPRK